MNSTFNRIFGPGVVALLIALCFIPAIAEAFAPGDGQHDEGFDMRDRHRPVLGIWRDTQTVHKLGLTPEQVIKVKDADFTFRERHLALKAELDSLELQLDKAFSDDVVDNTVVLTLAEKISAVKGKLFVQDIESRLVLGKILNADQIQKLRRYEMHQQRKGPGPSEKHISRHDLSEKSGDGRLCGN